MAALPADRVQVVVLGMALFTKAGIVVRAPGTPFAVASARALRPLSFFVCDCDHLSTLGIYFRLPIRLSDNAVAGEYHKPADQSWWTPSQATSESTEIDRRFYQYNGPTRRFDSSTIQLAWASLHGGSTWTDTHGRQH